MTWTERTGQATPIENVASLPLYAYQFFFRNLGGFRFLFWFLTLVSVGATVLNFSAVYLLGDLITTLTTSAPNEIFTFYLPLLVGIKFLDELLDYFTRRFGEAFPRVYGDFVSLRLSLSVLRLSPQRVANLSAQRLQLLIGRYAGNVASFADAWFWTISRRITELLITVAVLASQSFWVLLFNVIYFGIFLWIALRISRQFSTLAAKYAEQDINSGSTIGGFLVNLSTVRRLGITDFFLYNFSHELAKKWERLDEVRRFHARRWLLQLNLYNLGYIATLLWGAYQVHRGELSLGFLVLIKYAFDTLYHIFVWIIEYYVSLVQQREDGIIIRNEFSSLAPSISGSNSLDIAEWKEIALSNIQLSFVPSAKGETAFLARIPNLRIARGDKIGVIGASGTGKSSLVSAILNLVEFEGTYLIDGVSASGLELKPSHEICLINNTDPLFPISLKNNLTLGRQITPERIRAALTQVCAEDFTADLEAMVGSVNFNLSAGQQQRIRLARGLLQDSSLYLLDEPFNGIDEETKLKIIQNLKAHLREKAIVLVTHNPDELALIETIFEFKDGELLPSKSRL